MRLVKFGSTLCSRGNASEAQNGQIVCGVGSRNTVRIVPTPKLSGLTIVALVPILKLRIHGGIIMPGGITLLRSFVSLLLLCAACCLSGCSEEQQNAVRQRRDNLDKIWQAYAEMYKTDVSPKNVGELAAWMAESADAGTRGAARDSLVEGDVVVNWNGDLSVPETLGNFVLAFEAGTLARGGYVVMADGKVKNMTLKEFQAAAMLPASQP